MTTIYVCRNNGVLAVIGEAGKAQLDQVHEIAHAIKEMDYRSKYALTLARDAYDVAYQRVGRIPTATFVYPEYYHAYAPYVTGTMDEFERLSADCSVVGETIGVPFSNGGVSTLPREELMQYTVSLSEVLEIFGLEITSRTPSLV